MGSLHSPARNGSKHWGSLVHAVLTILGDTYPRNQHAAADCESSLKSVGSHQKVDALKGWLYELDFGHGFL